jgi:hypothetical protein
LNQDELLGMVENTNGLQVRQLNAEYMNLELQQTVPEATPLGEAKKVFILEITSVTVPDDCNNRYAELFLKHHDGVSQCKHDLSRCKMMLHDICLKSNEPIYVKQFMIPNADQQEVAYYMKEWFKLRVV